jgi:hypothetical protein
MSKRNEQTRFVTQIAYDQIAYQWCPEEDSNLHALASAST